MIGFFLILAVFITILTEKNTRISPMWISCLWHGKCNTIAAKIYLMKKTIAINLALILLFYFLLQVLLPF